MRNYLEKGIRFLKHRYVRGALILVYHRISEAALDPWSLSVKPDHFAEHLDVLRQSFHPKSLQEVARSLRDGKKLPNRSVVVTFDDGYSDNRSAALPLLERFNIPATMFLVSGAIGSRHGYWWDELTALLLEPGDLPNRLDLSINGQLYSWQLGQAATYRAAEYTGNCGWRVGQPWPTFRHELYQQLWQRMHPLSSEEQAEVMRTLRAWAGNSSVLLKHPVLSTEECEELAKAEQIEIGAHTVHHLSLASLPVDSQRAEISDSKAHLEGLVNRPVQSFSYPYGKRHDYSQETVVLVQEAGFSVACCNEPGVVETANDPFQLPRIHVPDCNREQFKMHLFSKFQA